MDLARNRMIRFVVAVALAAALTVFSMPESVHAISGIRDEIKDAEEDKGELEEQIGDKQEEISGLKDQRKSLQEELEDLNAQLTEVSERLADLEAQIAAKEQEIADTQAALDKARATEEGQYTNMKQNIRTMYESSNLTYLELLFTSGNFMDFLNMADFMERVNDYNRELFNEYQETRKFIESEEARLQGERVELEDLKEQAQAEQARVSELIEETSKRISQYSDQISSAEQQALAYEQELKKLEENLEYLKKKLEEELRKAREAAQAKWRDISDVTFSDGDLKLLANIIYCEAGSEPYAGKLAVGAVVINRVRSSVFPDTVVGVIYQKSQFSPVASGRLDLALASDRATDSCYQAAQEAMSGMTNVGNCVYFRTPVEGLTGTSIGGHIFY